MGPSGMDDANSEVYFRHQNERFSRDHINSLETTAKALVKTIADLEAAAKESQATISIQSSRIAALEADAARMDFLDSIGAAYGFEDTHEGNRWMVDGPFSSVRAALDALKGGA